MFRARSKLLAMLAIVLGIAFGAMHPNRAVAEILSVLYEIRPPYYVEGAEGRLDGLVGGPTVKAFALAGIEVSWVRRRFNRQITIIKENEGPVCSPGWFQNTERAAFARFSETIYRDHPQVVVIEAERSSDFEHSSLKQLISDADLRFGAKRAYSYGDYVDSLLESQNVPIQRTARSVHGLIDLMMQDRFDYTIMAQEEYDSIAGRFENSNNPLLAIKFDDMPVGNDRHLMCSKSVDPEIIKRFNAALRSLKRQ